MKQELHLFQVPVISVFGKPDVKMRNFNFISMPIGFLYFFIWVVLHQEKERDSICNAFLQRNAF
ncbi:hypothetical protein NC651_010345 [Populus alba x Populus x berolinensis]|nr:hypothetical protein NC651_010345 [Populus alba x Populus x berolinensis]